MSICRNADTTSRRPRAPRPFAPAARDAGILCLRTLFAQFPQFAADGIDGDRDDRAVALADCRFENADERDDLIKLALYRLRRGRLGSVGIGDEIGALRRGQANSKPRLNSKNVCMFVSVASLLAAEDSPGRRRRSMKNDEKSKC
jgi:hypothetical protein